MTDERIERALGELDEHAAETHIRVDVARRILRELVEGERERCMSLFEMFEHDYDERIGWYQMRDAIRDGLTVEQLEEKLRGR